MIEESTITLEYIVSLLPIPPEDRIPEDREDYIETAIAAFIFEEDAQKWMENCRYNFEELKLYHLPHSKNG